MSQDICIDPNLPSYDYSELVCRVPAETPVAGTSVETISSALNPPLAPLFQRGESRPALFRDSAEFRRRMIRSALADQPTPQGRADFGSPLAHGLWGLAGSILPV